MQTKATSAFELDSIRRDPTLNYFDGQLALVLFMFLCHPLHCYVQD